MEWGIAWAFAGALQGHCMGSWSDFAIQQGLHTLPCTKGLGLEEEASAIYHWAHYIGVII